MEKHRGLPFQVGQIAESKSFMKGFRGAWFRSKIKEIGVKGKGKGKLGYALAFIDFPDEKVKWTQVYQKCVTHKNKSKEVKSELMVRPSYPPLYRENEVSELTTISESVVIVDGEWKVGDLVDWWTDGCYWSGTITHIVGDDKFQIMLLLPPEGEGASYEVFGTDLRPSLNWSPRHGWEVPLPPDIDGRCCARLIQPVTPAMSSALDGCKSPLANETLKKPSNSNAFEEGHVGANVDLDTGDSWLGKTICSDSVSSSHLVASGPDEVVGTTTEKDKYGGRSGSPKKMRTCGSIPLNSTCSDTIEAAIMDFEELANRVIWLKRILKVGVPVSNAKTPAWKFLEHRASSTPK